MTTGDAKEAFKRRKALLQLIMAAVLIWVILIELALYVKLSMQKGYKMKFSGSLPQMF